MGVRTWVPPNKTPDHVVRAIREADARGDKTRHAVAEEFGVSYDTVLAWCGRRVTPRQHRLALVRDARELHWEGYTYAYIAKQLGIPVSTCWEYVNRREHW